MAKIAFTPVVGDARGSAGRAVFTKARNGATLRIRTKGNNPQSVRQTAVRDQMTSVSRAWATTLDETERTAWRTYGALITRNNPVNGQTYHPSGNSIYTELTMNFLRATPAGTPPTTPPESDFVPPAATVESVEIAIVGTISGSFSAGVPSTTPAELLYQPLASVGRAYSADKWKSAGFAFDNATPFDVVGAIPTNDLGYPAYAFAYRYIDAATGQIGAIHVVGVLIPA